MSEFILGQRWFSHAETDLGLGTIVDIKGRQITINFPAINEQRIYASDNAPLTRIEYKPGDMIRTQNGLTAVVIKVIYDQGHLIYHAKDTQENEYKIDELELNCFIEITSPKQRMLNGQLDDQKAYQLHCETLLKLDKLQQSPVRGLLGTRTNLLPHQIYIAYEVARRYAPRVLLADEVGLGKTIEAGMIVHYQLYTGLANRILIIVPSTLIHQWLVEMLRRFNLHFSLLDKTISEGNPFESKQLIICALDDLTDDPELFDDVLSAHWDMVIVDEAHHLCWNDGNKDNNYHCIEALAKKCHGLLLLTATPEQTGIANHFARLRLLDPARFYELNAFLKEEKNHKQLSDIVKILLNKKNKALSKLIMQQLKSYLENEAPTNNYLNTNQRLSIVNKLLDRHGTGRIFMRNTRKTIRFPTRKLIVKTLSLPKLYASLTGKQTLFPEMEIKDDAWLKQDPRVQYLIDLLKKLENKKVLIICAHAKTAIALDKYLKMRIGIRSAAFYEGLSIIDRDRAAAYFADMEMGSQVLICSEIGSEGRNFQFAHHLILFDLPLNPDLLEQRIGRLDRIGQTQSIHIYVLYLEKTAQDILFNWYNEGLNIFKQSCAAAYRIYEKFKIEIHNALDKPKINISKLIDDTKKYNAKIKQIMHEGRDQLIEFNSCRKDIADEMITIIKTEEQPEALMDFMERMFDVWGVDYEEHSEKTWVLHPSNQMRIEYFPCLNKDSMTITFDREKALSREDLSFVSWEHPIVSESMEMQLNSEIGNAVIVTIEKQGIKSGTILLETFAAIKIIAPKQLQINRYLPLTPLRTLINTDREDYSKILSYETLNKLSKNISRQTAVEIIKKIKKDIEIMSNFAMELTESKLPRIKRSAKQQAEIMIKGEITRLQTLKNKNTAIRMEEIEFLEDQLHACTKAIATAKYELKAIRLIVAQ